MKMYRIYFLMIVIFLAACEKKLYEKEGEVDVLFKAYDEYGTANVSINLN